MTTLSANFTTTLDRAIEKELGKGTTAHTAVGNKSKPNVLTVVIHAPKLVDRLEDKVEAAIKKSLKLDSFGTIFNSPRKFQDSISYIGRTTILPKREVKEEVDLPLLRTLLEAGIPKMIAPGIKVSVPQEMRDKLMAAMKKLNYVPEAAAYSDGSTSWTAIASISADFDHDKFTAKLRKALGDFEGELNVRYYDLTKEEAVKLEQLILLEAASLDAVAKAKGLKKVSLPNYHDQPDIKRYALQTPKGKTVIEVEVSPKGENPRGDIEVHQGAKSTYFKKMADAVAHIEKLQIEVKDKQLDDAAIAKWLGNQMAMRLKLTDIKNLGFIEWGPKSTQLVERSGYEQLPYLIFVDGDFYTDEKAGLGKIGMTTKDFRDWLVKNGATKRDKPKRARQTYYD